MNLDELQSVQARERQTDSLQQLRASFYEDAAAFVERLREEREQAADHAEDPFDDPDVNRLTDDITTAERTIEAIYERRVGKVVKMASLAAAEMPTEEDGLTTEERDLFETLVGAIEDNRDRVLDAIAGEAPAGTVTGDRPDDADATATSVAGSAGGAAGGDESGAGADRGEGGVPPDADRPPAGGDHSPADGDHSPTDGDRSPVGADPPSTEGAGEPPAEPPGADIASDADGAGSAEDADGAATASDAAPTDAAAAMGAPASAEGAEAPSTASDADEPSSTPSGERDADAGEPPAGDEAAAQPTADAEPADSRSGDPVSDRDDGDVERTTVRVTQDVGAILGVDDREYDLAKSDVVTLPTANAEPLLERDAAERLE